jgi:hypothetical protein
MASIYRMLVGVRWGLGRLSMVLAVLLKLAPGLGEKFNASPHGGLVLAGVLSLCALATRDLEKAS